MKSVKYRRCYFIKYREIFGIFRDDCALCHALPLPTQPFFTVNIFCYLDIKIKSIVIQSAISKQ